MASVAKVCRICFQCTTNYSNLLSDIEVEEGTRIIRICIAELIRIITSDYLQVFQLEDNHPDSICVDCAELARASYLFKLKYENSFQYLNLLEKVVVKEEFQEDNYFIFMTNSDDENDKTQVEIHVEDTPNIKNSFPEESVGCTERNVENLDKLYPQRNRNISSHNCPICTMKFSASELKEHVKSHKALKKYLTIPEKQKVSSKVRFYSENATCSVIVPFSDRLHKCLYCDQQLPASEFKGHLKSHKHDVFKCNECGRVFKKRNHLNGHRVRAHSKEFPYNCEHCQKGFVLKSNYDCHLLTHSNKELPHECSYCSKRFSNPIHLYRHLSLHTKNSDYNSKFKNPKCYQCLSTFETREKLKSHNCDPTNFENNVKNFKEVKQVFHCKFCKNTFMSKAGVYQHIQRMHAPNGGMKLCSVCGLSVRNINYHMMKHRGDKAYACNQCEKRFFRKQQLERHLNVHTGLKNYVCSVCAKTFNFLYNLQVHERIHTGVRNHLCHICNKAFLEKSYLKKHLMKVHHKLI